MNAVTAPLLAAVIGVGGALASLVFERLLRRLGRLWCEPADGRGLWIEAPDEMGAYEMLPRGQEWRAQSVGYSFEIDLFNSRETPLGLRGIHLVFNCAGARSFITLGR